MLSFDFARFCPLRGRAKEKELFLEWPVFGVWSFLARDQTSKREEKAQEMECTGVELVWCDAPLWFQFFESEVLLRG